MTLFDLFLKGGPIMWFILATSLLATYLVVQKLITLSKVKVDGAKFILEIRSVLGSGDVKTAVSICSKAGTPLARILRAGLLKMKGAHQEVKDAVESAARMEVYRLERGLGLLASIAGIAPLLGFLGTVTGMIGAFRVIEINEGVVNPQLLASGIWEALLTTAFGLMVGIPAYFIYNYLVTRVSNFVFETESSCNDFLDIALVEQRKAQIAVKKARMAREAAQGKTS